MKYITTHNFPQYRPISYMHKDISSVFYSPYCIGHVYLTKPQRAILRVWKAGPRDQVPGWWQPSQCQTMGSQVQNTIIHARWPHCQSRLYLHFTPAFFHSIRHNRPLPAQITVWYSLLGNYISLLFGTETNTGYMTVCKCLYTDIHHIYPAKTKMQIWERISCMLFNGAST